MKKLFYGAFALLFIASSCSEAGVNGPVSDPNALTFKSSITTASRATGNQFDQGDEISVTAYAEDGSIYKANALYTYSDTFTSADPIVYTEDGQMLSFWAVYPYTELSEAGEVEFSVLKDQSEGTNYTLSDLMYSYAGATSESTPTLTFNHLLSNVIVNISSEEISLVNIEPYLEAATDVNYNIFTGATTASETKSQISMASNGTNSYKAIIIPQSYAAGDTIGCIWVDGLDYPIVANKAYEFKAGKEYVFDLEIAYYFREIELVFSDVTINDWGTDAGDRTETQVAKTSYSAPDLLPGDCPGYSSSYGISSTWDGNSTSLTSAFVSEAYTNAINKTVTFCIGDAMELTRFSLFTRSGRNFGGTMIKRFNIYGATELTDDMYIDDETGFPDYTGWSPILINASCLPISGSDTATDDDVTYLVANGSEFTVPEGRGEFKYIRIEFLEAWDGGSSISLSEVEFWGYLSEN
ncbi:MAG: fimbrillin family protein [Rikenellaceae bacterium]